MEIKINGRYSLNDLEGVLRKIFGKLKGMNGDITHVEKFALEFKSCSKDGREQKTYDSYGNEIEEFTFDSTNKAFPFKATSIVTEKEATRRLHVGNKTPDNRSKVWLWGTGPD